MLGQHSSDRTTPNIAYETVDWHVAAGGGDRVDLRRALLHFTGGATGPPKGVAHTQDPRPGDVCCYTVDPGSLIGTTYGGILGPLAHGLTVVVADRLRPVPPRTPLAC